MDSLFKDSPSARHILWALSLLLVMWGVLTACDSRPTSQRHSPSTSVPTAGSTPAVVATLPRLTSETGWHDVLTMSDTTGSGIQSMRQSFTASKPYVIFFSCKGSGSLHVSYGQTEETAPCSGNPELNGTQTLRPAYSGEPVDISVTPNGLVTWELLVSMAD
jgi:hypothetical protein